MMNTAFALRPILTNVTRFTILVAEVITNFCDVLVSAIVSRIPPVAPLVRPPRPRVFLSPVSPAKPPFEPSRVILHGRLALRRLS